MVYMKTIAPFLDLASHKASTAEKEVSDICQKVLEYGFNSAFVNPAFIELAHKKLSSHAKVGSVVAFPLGQEALALKIYSAQNAIHAGADELDVSLNISHILTADYRSAFEEMKQIVQSAKQLNPHIIIKFILETGYLNDTQIKKGSQLILKSKADFIKTCSGMGPRGARLKDVKLIKSAIKNEIKIKVAGGISTYEQAKDFITAGAHRIGTSKAVKITQSCP